MKIDANVCFNGIFPIYQQTIGAVFLWKVISDIPNKILGKKVESSDKIKDFTYGIITILPVVGTIFNLFLYIVVFKINPADTLQANEQNNDSEGLTTPRTEEPVDHDSAEVSKKDEPVSNSPRDKKVDLSPLAGIERIKQPRSRSFRDVLGTFNLRKKDLTKSRNSTIPAEVKTSETESSKRLSILGRKKKQNATNNI